MERVVRIYDDMELADADARAERMAMDPIERVRILLQLVRDYYAPSEGLERVLRVTELEGR